MRRGGAEHVRRGRIFRISHGRPAGPGPCRAAPGVRLTGRARKRESESTQTTASAAPHDDRSRGLRPRASPRSLATRTPRTVITSPTVLPERSQHTRSSRGGRKENGRPRTNRTSAWAVGISPNEANGPRDPDDLPSPERSQGLAARLRGAHSRTKPRATGGPGDLTSPERTERPPGLIPERIVMTIGKVTRPHENPPAAGETPAPNEAIPGRVGQPRPRGATHHATGFQRRWVAPRGRG
jgi:hypothetical protein